MVIFLDTVDGRNPASVGSLSHDLQGFLHAKRCTVRKGFCFGSNSMMIFCRVCWRLGS